MPSPNVARPQAVLGLLTVLGVLTACGGPDESPKGAGPIPVTVVTLTPQSVTLTRELAGRSTAFLVAEVRPQVNGIVATRLFTEGGLVKAGEPLYQIDDATYRADDQSAKANLARAQATLVTAQFNAERSANLIKIDAVSKQDDENAAAALREAEADVRGRQGGGRPHRRVPRLCPHHGADQRPHRQVHGDPGRAGNREPDRRAHDGAAARSDVRRPDAVERRVAGTAQGPGRGALKGTRDLPVKILLEDGTQYPHDGKLAFRMSRSTRRRAVSACA